MRVLTFYDGRRTVARRVQIDFLKCLNEYCTYMTYGPKEYEMDSTLAPEPYHPKKTIQDVIKKLEPDIILHYQSLVAQKAVKLIKGFDKLKLPSILLEVDIHDVEDGDWARDNNIQYILHRGTYSKQLMEQFKLPTIWLPHAASNEFFNTEKKRYNKIVFAGNGRYSTNILYRTRQKAIRILEKRDYIDYLGSVGYQAYPEILRTYIGGLTCSTGTNKSILGKHFEIMGSQTALLTPHFTGEETLFGSEPFAFFYKEDMSDITEVSDRILDETVTAEIAKRGLSIIDRQHRYTHRAYELYKILLAVAGGTPVPRKWGR